MSGQKQLLSNDEIDALVEGMQRGDVDTTANEAESDTPVKPYSLVATDTVSRGQLAALEMINDRFARQLRTSMLNLLRQGVKISVVPYTVTTFGEYIQTIPSPCNVNIVRFPPLRGYGLVTLEPAVVYGAVDSFFGGSGEGLTNPPASRVFTPTEERIIQLLLDAIFEDLKEAWAPVYNLSPEYVSREINPAFAQIGEERETVVVSRFELELGMGVRGQLTLMYPFSALKPIRLLLRGRLQSGERDEKLAARWSTQLKDAVEDAELELIVQLAQLRVSAMDLASISPGDTLWFKPPESVKVLVQANHLYDAEYGQVDNNMAVRITQVIDPISSDDGSELDMGEEIVLDSDDEEESGFLMSKAG